MPPKTLKQCRPPCAGLVRDGICDICGRQWNSQLSRHRELCRTPRPWHAWYKSKAWDCIKRRRYSESGGICAECHRVTDAGIHGMEPEVDHITPHRGDRKLFFDYSNTALLCKGCHSRKTAHGG